jgi:predicted ATPase
VLDASGALAQSVVERGPGVRVLASSREGLGVPGERILAVRSLEPGAAAELFRARVADHHGGFEVSDADRQIVDELCQRLDGLPLAIELAAARARSMSLADLTSRLGDRFRLLRGQRRATERHQTLGPPWPGRTIC